METKQTAVEWLIEELGEYFPNEIGGIHLMVVKAKAIEKEQIKDAYLEASKQACWSYGEEPPSEDNKYAEDYYNKTYFNPYFNAE